MEEEKDQDFGDVENTGDANAGHLRPFGGLGFRVQGLGFRVIDNYAHLRLTKLSILAESP